MIRIMLAIAALSIGAAHAQTNWTQTQIGGYTYYNGEIDGKPFNASQYNIGDSSYSTLYQDGKPLNCTSTTIGDQIYVNCF